MGEYVKAGEHGGKPYYLQRDTLDQGDMDCSLDMGDMDCPLVHFLFYDGTDWLVGPELGRSWGGLKSHLDTELPPTDQWRFWDGEKWTDNDHTFTLEYASLSLTCELIRVTGEGAVVEQQGNSLGDYRSV